VLPIVLVNITNNDRGEEGLTELTVNPILEEAARMKVEHMVKNSYFAHVSPDGLDPWYWLYRAGYTFTEAGENLAVNFSDSEDVVKAWMNSPGHRANILNGKFTEIGIAAAKGQYKGKKTVFVVQMFGTPAKIAQAPVPDTSLTTTIATAASSSGTAPTVAGAAAEVRPAPSSAPDTSTIVKESMTAHVPGAIAAPAAEIPAHHDAGMFASMGARPRAVVSFIYLLVGLLVSFVLLLMVFKQVHRDHPRSMSYGCALLVLILVLSYLNWLLLSADLVIA
jgi:hypothetical protein